MNVIVETFMLEYFLFASVIGNYLTDGKRLFAALGNIFLLPETDTDKLYALAENKTAKQIKSDKDFMLYLRMQKYLKLIGAEQEANADREEIVCLKGNAVLMAQNYKLALGAEMSSNMVHTCLSMSANSGTVAAMRIIGILQCEGIFFDKDEKEGLKNLAKAADWNDCVSILALLRFNKDNRRFNMAKLRAVVKDTPFAKVYAVAAKEYETDQTICVEEVELLNKAFDESVLNREIYEPNYARILKGNLCVKDKVKAVFSHNKEQISAICHLPLKLSYENITAIEADVKDMTIKRATEIATVNSLLVHADLRELPVYRPLCICSDSRYLLNMYAMAVSSQNKSVHTETIEVAELTEYDLSPTPNNIFVRSTDEDKDNRLLLFFCGEIHKAKIDVVKSFLQSERRAKFQLNAPVLTLNLGAVLPVCFCDQKNAEILKPYCDMVMLAPLTTAELSSVLQNIFADKEKLYGVAIKLGGKAEEVFGDCDIDFAEKLIDSAVRVHNKGSTVTLTSDNLQRYKLTNDRPRMGFGGFTDGRDN